MYKTLRKVLLLFLVTAAFVCGTLFAVACGKGGNDDDKDAKVTYSVTVTLASDVTDVTLTSLKAQWYSGSDAASDAISLSSEGKASVDLDAGNYTVDLIGVPDTATYTKASVTASSRNATINVTKKVSGAVDLAKPSGLKISGGVLTWNAVTNASSYDVYLGKDVVENVKVASYTIPSDLADGTYSYSVVAKGDGVNYNDSPISDPVIHFVKGGVSHNVPNGGSEHWYEVWGDWSHVDGDPYDISALGTYYIPVEVSENTVYADVIKFTAPEAGEHSYTFSWDFDPEVYTLSYVNSNVGLDDDSINGNGDYNDYSTYKGSLIFSLSQGDEVIIVLQYEDWTWNLKEGDEVGYEITIESGDPIPLGSLYRPFEIEELEGEHSAPADYDKSEAYFALPYIWTNSTYIITFEEGVSVYFLAYGAGSDEFKALLSNNGVLSLSAWSKPYLYVTAVSGAQIKFSLEKVILPGSIDDPIEIQKDEDVSYNFETDESVWYYFTPDASGYYRIVAGDNFNGLAIYSSIDDGYAGGWIIDVDSFGRNDVYLVGGNNYYFNLYSNYGNEVGFKLIDTPSGVNGGISNPIDLNNNNPYSADYSSTDVLYFVYTASADGVLKLITDAEDGFGVTIYIYSDEHYSELIQTYYSDGYPVDLGDVIHIVIEYTQGDSLNISAVLQPRLAAPTGLSINGNELSWNSVPNAVGYAIYSDWLLIVPNVASDLTSYSLFGLLSAGTHQIFVVALGDDENYLDSKESDSVEYTVTHVDYEFTVVDEFNLSGLKVELYVFDANNELNKRGEKIGEANVVDGSATISAPDGFYVAVLTGYDEDVYTADQVVLENNKTATFTVAKVVYVDFGITIEGLDKVAGHDIHLSVTDVVGTEVLNIKIESSLVTFKLKEGFSGFVTISDLPDGYTVDREDINSQEGESSRVAVTLYIVEQPTLDLDQDWIDVVVLPYKTLQFKLGSSVKTGVQYYILIDPDSVNGQGPEFAVNHSDGSTVNLTPQGNYWAGINFSSLQLSITNNAATNLELRFKLISEEPANYIEDGETVSLQPSSSVPAKVTTGESVTEGTYFLTVGGKGYTSSITITIYIGEDDYTGNTFVCNNNMWTPANYKVQLKPGVVIRAETTNEGAVTFSMTITKVPEGKEISLGGYTNFRSPGMQTIDLSGETAGTTVTYTVNFTGDIYFGEGNGHPGCSGGDGDVVTVYGEMQYANIPDGISVTVDFGGDVKSSEGYGNVSHTFTAEEKTVVSNTWTVTIVIAANADLSNAALTLIYGQNIEHADHT